MQRRETERERDSTEEDRDERQSGGAQERAENRLIERIGKHLKERS